MALSCQIVTDKNKKQENSNTNNNVSETSIRKKQKYTLYLYPFTLDDTEVQFMLHIYYKNSNEKWEKSKHFAKK